MTTKDQKMTITETYTDPVQVLAGLLMDATETHGELHNALKGHVQQVADTVLTAVLAKNERGTELRAALGVEVTKTTRMGKNLRAAMDAYTAPSPGVDQL